MLRSTHVFVTFDGAVLSRILIVIKMTFVLGNRLFNLNLQNLDSKEIPFTYINVFITYICICVLINEYM